MTDNTYIIDPEDAAEMARLMKQDHFITGILGGIPEDCSGSVVDLACGPGGWALSLAEKYLERGIRVVGVDISTRMIAYAAAQAQARDLENNCSFQVANILQPLSFPDTTFDLVNARFLAAMMPSLSWPGFTQECVRIARPGGVIRLTETEMSCTNKPALATLFSWVSQAMHAAGQGFSPLGQFWGVIPMLRFFLSNAGCVDIKEKAVLLNVSYGAPSYEQQSQNLRAGFLLMRPFLEKHKIAKDFDAVYQQALQEMQEPDYCNSALIVTAEATKPV